MAQAAFDQVLVELGASTAGLWLIQAGTIRFIGGAGVGDGLPHSVTVIPLDSQLPAAMAIRTGRVVSYSSREERDRRWPELIGVGYRAEGIVVLPLLSSGRPLGCLHIGFTQPFEFDQSFLERLSELCAAALDRAQLHDSLRERQTFLLDASQAVANASGFKEALVGLADIAVPRLADLCIIDVIDEEGQIKRMVAHHADPAKADLVQELFERYPPEIGSRHPAVQSMAERRSLWLSEMPEEFLRQTTRDARHLELTHLLGFTSFMCVPLVVAGQAHGALTLISAGSGRRFGASDLSLAEDLATRLSGVVLAAQRREQEQEVSHILQRLLLPDDLPLVAGLELAARYMTARSGAEAGGDFYDVVTVPSGRIGFMIGDVEGHDPVAAAIMGQLRSAIRARAGQHREPHLLIDAVRWSWDLLGFSRMATCLVGRVDPSSGALNMTSAGHLPPVRVKASGGADLLVVGQTPPLGAPGRPAADSTHHMDPGDILFLYTDGLIEGGRTGIDTKLAQLVSSLADASEMPLGELCQMVIDTHVEHINRPDDVAMMAIRRLPAD